MKRFLAILLSITLIFSTLAISTMSAQLNPSKHYAGVGNYTVELESDLPTDTPSSKFGTPDANGKVWTDKSVVVNQDHFEVTLSALAQEYISLSTENSTSSVAADVVMILDLSASMQNNSVSMNNTTMTSTKAMVMAVNEALEIIMQANEKNRVLIYTYQSNSSGSAPVTNELLPLGHYTNTSWNNEEVFSGNNGKYFNYSTSGSSGVISSANNLMKDGSSFSRKSISTASGTCTQHGIMKGVQTLVNAIGKETKSEDRKPYILLFTDGAPGNATKSWYNSSVNTCNFTHANEGSAEISALTVLSAAYMKNSLDTAYRTYNGKNMGIEWFNIGLGVGNKELGKLFLQPWTIATSTSNNAKNIRKHISTYTSDSYSDYSSYATNYSYTSDSYLVDSGTDLAAAFTELAQRIEEETKVITSPIITTQGSVSDLTFTDIIGEGLSVRNIYLHPDDDTAIYGIASSSGSYSFEGYDTTAIISTDAYGRLVVTWNIPADEVAIFSFANRSDPTDGNYIPADPIRLTYDVKVDNPNNYNGETLYCNAEAKAEFKIPGDNTYYYETDGTLKTTPFATQSKVQNITGLLDFSTSYTTNPVENGASITAVLGNNGKLSPSTLLEKTAENPNVESGTAVTFSLLVTNKGKTNLTDVTITDTLPEGLTYKADTVKNATLIQDASVLTFTIPSIATGQTIAVTYDVVLTEDAEAGDTFINTASITRINEVLVYGPIETSSTITAYRTYRVLYEWSGNIPSGVVIPKNDNRYTPGAYYPIDNNFTSQTKIENKDRFGNISERWSFSGWEDENLSLMGEADVTIRGVWSYENFTYPAHKVIYTWSGEIPPEKTPPVDGNSYIKNQPYTVDETYSAATVIETKDSYGNVNGRYTFSGWADPNHGVMDEADVTVTGVWNYETLTVPTHKVIYTWSGEIPPNKAIPVNNNTYVKNQSYPVDITYSDATVIYTYDAYGNTNGKYTFSGWEDPGNKTMGDADITISGVWSFESVKVPTYRVFYVWSGEVPPNKTLPTNNNSYVKNQSYSVDSTFTSSTVIYTYDTYGNINGKYTFSGWNDPCEGIIIDSDVTIRGVWEYKSVPVPTHKVIYTWSGDIPEGSILPTNPLTYVKNQSYPVDDTFTSSTVVYTYDAYGNINGKHTFSGWNDPNNKIMGDADVTIRGVWKYEAFNVPTHKVLYSWTGSIPENKVLPTDGNRYVKNQPYNVDSTYNSATVIPTYDKFGNMNGRYTFSGWNDPNNEIMGDSDVTVRGVWSFETLAVPTHKVIYTWSGEIPPQKVLPVDQNSYVKNQSYLVDNTFTSATVIPTYDEFGNTNGRYTFSGWDDPNNKIMGDTDITIRGVWSYESIIVDSHKVIYTWSGAIPETETLPSNGNFYVKNQEYPVDTTYTSQTSLQVFDDFGNVNGRYSFSGWNDPNNRIMGDADVTISGVWIYEAVDVLTHKVYYTWSGEIPADAVIPSDANSYAKNQKYSVDTTFTSATEVLSHDAFGNINGKYTFSGWEDPNSGVMGDADVTVSGVWSYEAITVPAYKVIYTWSGDIPPSEMLPSDINSYVNNQPYTIDTTYTAETVIKTKNSDGKVNGKYTFSGWSDPNSGVMGDADVTVSGIWKFESITPSEDEADNTPNSPATGESKSINGFYIIWIVSLLGMLLLLPLRKKNKK